MASDPLNKASGSSCPPRPGPQLCPTDPNSSSRTHLTPSHLLPHAEMLSNITLRALSLPRGSKAWCPSLLLNTTGYPREPNPLSLVLAVNAKYVMKNMTWRAAMADDLASVAVAGIWWSAKQRPVPVTVITQATVDRLPQVGHRQAPWPLGTEGTGAEPAWGPRVHV